MTSADYATPEQIERNRQRLEHIGDVNQTGNLLFEWETSERARIENERRDAYAEMDRRREAEAVRHACGDDLPLFA